MQVYNSKTKTERTVTLTPSRTSWSGDGLLGVTIRFDTYANCDENVCRVCEVDDESPAQMAGLISDSDYILGSAEKVYPTADSLQKDLSDNLNKPMELFVWNADEDKVRIVIIMPTTEWGSSDQNSMLGAVIGHGYLHGLPSTPSDALAAEGAGNSSVAAGAPPLPPSQAEVAVNGETTENSTGCGSEEEGTKKLPAAPKASQSPFGSHDKIEVTAAPQSTKTSSG